MWGNTVAWHTRNQFQPPLPFSFFLSSFYYQRLHQHELRKAAPIITLRALLEDHSNHVEDYGRWCAYQRAGTAQVLQRGEEAQLSRDC